jgi:F0F1-type ATP synthase assembly protein I
MNLPNSGKEDQKQRTVNVIIAVLVAQVGCVTLAILLGALFGGLWLDNHFGTKPTYTIVFLLVSIPVSVILMLLIARKTIAKMRADISKPKNLEERNNIGTDQSR